MIPPNLDTGFNLEMSKIFFSSSRKELDTAQRMFVLPYDFAECAEVLRMSRLGQQVLYDDILVVKSHSEHSQ